MDGMTVCIRWDRRLTLAEHCRGFSCGVDGKSIKTLLTHLCPVIEYFGRTSSDSDGIVFRLWHRLKRERWGIKTVISAPPNATCSALNSRSPSGTNCFAITWTCSHDKRWRAPRSRMPREPNQRAPRPEGPYSLQVGALLGDLEAKVYCIDPGRCSTLKVSSTGSSYAAKYAEH
jgi:hypothetical protein